MFVHIPMWLWVTGIDRNVTSKPTMSYHMVMWLAIYTIQVISSHSPVGGYRTMSVTLHNVCILTTLQGNTRPRRTLLQSNQGPIVRNFACNH